MVNVSKLGGEAQGIYNGIEIDFSKELVSLTDMWKATGKLERKKPKFWLENAGTQELIEVLRLLEKGRISSLLEIKRGRTGGTFAHWQLAVAYAAFLDPHFQLWIGNLVRERFEEAANPELGLERAEIRARPKAWWWLHADCRPFLLTPKTPKTLFQGPKHPFLMHRKTRETLPIPFYA